MFPTSDASTGATWTDRPCATTPSTGAPNFYSDALTAYGARLGRQQRRPAVGARAGDGPRQDAHHGRARPRRGAAGGHLPRRVLSGRVDLRTRATRPSSTTHGSAAGSIALRREPREGSTRAWATPTATAPRDHALRPQISPDRRSLRPRPAATRSSAEALAPPQGDRDRARATTTRRARDVRADRADRRTSTARRDLLLLQRRHVQLRAAPGMVIMNKAARSPSAATSPSTASSTTANSRLDVRHGRRSRRHVLRPGRRS